MKLDNERPMAWKKEKKKQDWKTNKFSYWTVFKQLRVHNRLTYYLTIILISVYCEITECKIVILDWTLVVNF